MENQIEQIKTSAISAIGESKNLSELDSVRVKYLGKKGELTSILRGMGKLSADEKPRIGKLVNDARSEIESVLESKNLELQKSELETRLQNESIDITLPGRKFSRGHLHPLTLTLNRIKKIFLNMGYSIEEGPEIETDYFNFEALNLPKDHPARDAQDSFYITDEILMRTQTSPVQARTMQARSSLSSR